MLWRHFASAASLPSKNNLILAFRGGDTPTVAIADYLERIQRNLHCESVIFVLAAVYLARFVRSRTAREAGLLVEPATAHRLVSVALLLAAKFSSPNYAPNSPKVIPVCSNQRILASEFAGLEVSFLRAIDYRLLVTEEQFLRYCGHVERGPMAGGCCGGRKRKSTSTREGDKARNVQACQKPAMAS